MLKRLRRGHVTYFRHFGTPSYLGNEVVITQPWIELSYRNLVSIETWTLLSLNPTPGWISNSIWPQFLNFTNRYDVITLLCGYVWMTFGRQMLNHVEKWQILL